MKKSLFKRAVAAFAAIPLALTQCLSVSYAVDDTAVLAADNNKSVAADSTEMTIDSLLYINPESVETSAGVQTSTWNVSVYQMLANIADLGKGALTLDPTSAYTLLSANAGRFGEALMTVLNQVKDIKGEIVSDGTIKITGSVDDLSGVMADEAQAKLDVVLADVYAQYPEVDFSEVQKVDLSGLGELSGSFEAVVDWSGLEGSTNIPVSYVFTTSNGNEYTLTGDNNVFDLVESKYGVIKAEILEAVKSVDNAEAAAQIEALFANYDAKIAQLQTMVDKYSTADFTVSRDYATTENALQGIRNFMTKQGYPNAAMNIPTSFTAALTADKGSAAYADFAAQINNFIAPYSMNIDAAELGAELDSWTEISVDAASGVWTLGAKIDDAEQADVIAYYATAYNKLVTDTWKEITVTIDANAANTGAGSVQIDLIRVIVAEDITTTTTEVTTTDSSSTTTEVTTTEVTSDTTDTSVTTTDVTTDVTSDTTDTSVTTTEVTTEVTSDTTDTSVTTTEVTTTEVTSDTTDSSATTTEVTTTDVTSDTTDSSATTTEVTTTDVTSDTTDSSVTTTEVTTTDVTSDTTTDVTTDPTATTTEETTTEVTTTTVTTNEDQLEWVVGTVVVDVTNGDQEAVIEITVNDDNANRVSLLGADFSVSCTGGFDISAYSSSSTAYRGATITYNAELNKFQLSRGNAAAGTDNGTIMTVTFTVPAGTAAGTYPVTIENFSAYTTDSSDISEYFVMQAGYIQVVNNAVTETTTDVTTTSDGGETTTTEVTTSVVAIYAEAETVEGYYFSHDNRGFNAGQIVSVMGYAVITDGTTETTMELDITADVTFGDATPQSVFATELGNVYQIPMYYNGMALVDVNGAAITATAYIGVKGDSNLDNIADGVDASNVLQYYTKIQTGSAPEALTLGNSDSKLENLAAFLADVDMDEYEETNWQNGKTTDNQGNGLRHLDGVDASFILQFYTKQQTNKNTPAYDIWVEMFPETVLAQN